MEKMKKVLSFTLSVLMTMSAAVSVSPTVFADENEIPIEIPAASYTLDNILNQSVKELNIHDTVNFTLGANVQNVTFYFVESNYSGETLEGAEKITLSENGSVDVPQKSSDSDKAVSAKSKWTIAQATNEDGSAKVILVSDIPRLETVTKINEMPDMPDYVKNIDLKVGEKFPSMASAVSEFPIDRIKVNGGKTDLFYAVKFNWFESDLEGISGRFIDPEKDTVQKDKCYLIVMSLVADVKKADVSLEINYDDNNWQCFSFNNEMIFCMYKKIFQEMIFRMYTSLMMVYN